MGNRYKDDVMTFFGDQNLCTLIRGVPKERFHCNLIVVLGTCSTSLIFLKTEFVFILLSIPQYLFPM